MMNSQTQAAGRKSGKTQLPVSRKFYETIVDRATTSFAMLGDPEEATQLVEVVDRYMMSGEMPGEHESRLVRLAFQLLKAEIDKAMARSAAARKRRKTVKAGSESVAIEENKIPEAAVPSSVDACFTQQPDNELQADSGIMLNRRERRRLERLRMRQVRRCSKPSKK